MDLIGIQETGRETETEGGESEDGERERERRRERGTEGRREVLFLN
jgi:hypothetical protein